MVKPPVSRTAVPTADLPIPEPVQRADGTVVIPGRRQAPLPEPGYARDEENKKRMDDLEDMMSKLLTTLQADGVVDVGPGKNVADMGIENEIASQFDLLAIPGKQDHLRYAWANFSAQHGIQVTTLQALGYEVVVGERPECPKRRDELGRRRIGDVILMSIPLDEYVALQARNRALNQSRKASAEGKFIEIGARLNSQGISTRNTLSNNEIHRAFTQQMARQLAGNMLKNG